MAAPFSFHCRVHCGRLPAVSANVVIAMARNPSGIPSRWQPSQRTAISRGPFMLPGIRRAVNMPALKLNGRQMAALHLLNRATHIATTSGLFDSVDAADAITPRTINEFCDGLGEMTKDLPFG